MSWFTKMCRSFGELTHDIIAPVEGDKQSKVKQTEVKKKSGSGEGVVSKEVVKREVETKRIDETTVLRRTTIEEIEVRRERVDDVGGVGEKGSEQ